jgi:hypothetical protein
MTEIEEKRKDRRKQTAEVFTPKPLVREILDKLPSEVWSDPNKTFCDPAAGNGNFLIEVLKYKVMKYNHDVIDSLKTIYGYELMEDNVDELKNRLSKLAFRLLKKENRTSENKTIIDNIISKNIICCDTLEYFKNQKNTVIDV